MNNVRDTLKGLICTIRVQRYNLFGEIPNVFPFFFVPLHPMETGYVATIGCFDGVHRGHRLLIEMVRREAQSRGLLSMVITFDRLPRELFDPSFQPRLLTTLEEKTAIIRSLGIDTVEVLPFNSEVASMTAQMFMQQVLSEELHVSVLITGYDNRFGHNRDEGFEDYVRYGKQLGMDVLRGEEERFPNTLMPVSSSAIRQLLLQGDVSLAAQGLSQYYQLTGEVVSGEHIGHELGFPTANLQLDSPQRLIPAPGVYAVWAKTGQRVLPAMMNIGNRPTFHGTHQTLEVHILETVGDLYGEQLTVAFVEMIRSEIAFESREALVKQLEGDKKEIMKRLIPTT